MHVMATNICVWIRTLVLESLKEVTAFYIARRRLPEEDPILEDLRKHTLAHAGMTNGVELGVASVDAEWIEKPSSSINNPGLSAEDSHGTLLDRIIEMTTQKIATIATTISSSTSTSTTTTTTTTPLPTTVRTTTEAPTTSFFQFNNIIPKAQDSLRELLDVTVKSVAEDEVTTPSSSYFDGLGKSISDLRPNPTSNIDFDIPGFLPQAEAFKDLSTIAPYHLNATSCERVNIMGSIVQDATPYLYPFIIEYSLIGAAVIYVMWKHIGRYPKVPDEDLEHRLEVMLTRRAQALAQAKGGRVDCVGASKGLFFGLLMLVGLIISLILFFILVKHEQFKWLAYYLADASHAGVMALAILAILIGFCR